MTDKGMYCPAGDFYIDPVGKVDCAIVTHAHADHARRGSKQYICAASGAALLKTRLGKKIALTSFPYGLTFALGGVTVSFHSAGHILGSAQVRLAQGGKVWVVTGDFKRDHDPSCEPFEIVPCDVLISEATFGTPAYCWDKSVKHGQAIHDWWCENRAAGYESILLGWSLGKSQRILAELAPHADQLIHCHHAIEEINRCYRNQGINLAPTTAFAGWPDQHTPAGRLILAPPSWLKGRQSRQLKACRLAFASGWMVHRPQYYHRGFVMSDHADWQDLLLTVEQTGAKTVYVQHRGAGALVKELNRRGIVAWPDTRLAQPQLDMFT